MTIENTNINDLPVAEEEKPVEEAPAEGGEAPQQEPQPPAENPEISALKKQMEELKADRDKAFALAEKFAPQNKPPEEEADDDPLSFIKDYEDGPTKQAIEKGLRSLQNHFDKKLQREVGKVRQSTEAQQLEQRAGRVVSDLLKNGVSEADLPELHKSMEQNARAAIARGERPDLEASYKAAAFDLLQGKQRRAGDAEQQKAADLAKRKANGSVPAGNANPMGKGKLSLDQIKVHVGKKKDVSIAEIFKMHDEAEKK